MQNSISYEYANLKVPAIISTTWAAGSTWMMEDCLSVDGGAVAGAESAKLKTAHCKLYIVHILHAPEKK